MPFLPPNQQRQSTEGMYYNTKKLKSGLVAFHDIQPGNGMDQFSKE